MSAEVLTLNSYKFVIFSEEVRRIIESEFRYDYEKWKRTPVGNKKRVIETSYIKKVKGKKLYYVDAGFIYKIVKILKLNKVDFVVDKCGGFKKFKAEFVELENGIKLRGNQPEVVKKALKRNRGVIHAYTSFGKTITAAALINAYLTKYPDSRAIFLAHTIDLVLQTAEEFKKILPFSVGVWQGKTKDDCRVVCVTRQTLARTSTETYADKFLVVIRDECHKSGEQYSKILYNLNCPVRYGVTATLPNSRLGSLQLEGSVGPVLATVTLDQGAESGLLAVPEIHMCSYDGSLESTDGRSYNESYKDLITNNFSRNLIIEYIVRYLIHTGESVLVLVREKDHGKTLKKSLGKDAILINGDTKKELRVKAKHLLETKKVKCVICSMVWLEGISIKSLNNCIFAGGGKDEKMVLQFVGRGVRIDEGKTSVNIWDFFDPYKWFAEHSLERLQVYSKKGWKINTFDAEADRLNKYILKGRKFKNGKQIGTSSKEKGS